MAGARDGKEGPARRWEFDLGGGWGCTADEEASFVSPWTGARWERVLWRACSIGVGTCGGVGVDRGPVRRRGGRDGRRGAEERVLVLALVLALVLGLFPGSWASRGAATGAEDTVASKASKASSRKRSKSSAMVSGREERGEGRGGGGEGGEGREPRIL